MHHFLRLLMLFALTGVATASAGEDYWQKNHCTRALPEPALVKKGVKGHTFKIVKRRGEALETAQIGDDRITIIHFGCEGVGWQIRTRFSQKAESSSNGQVYDRARRLLKTIEPKTRDLAILPEAIRVLDNYADASRGAPALAERLAITGGLEGSVSVSTAEEGKETWLTVMIYSGPL